MPPIRNILIALPTVSRGMKSGTAIAVTHTALALQAKEIAVHLHNIDSAEIVTARDMFANMLLYSGSWDALLFVDSDMSFEPSVVLRMLQQGSDVAAAACPRRLLDLHQFAAAMGRHGDEGVARSAGSQFTIFHDWDQRHAAPRDVRDGFCSAAAVGMAIALISKSALRAMVDAGVAPPRLDLSASGGQQCYSFFGILEPDGHRLGEDYSFCYRWTKLLNRTLRVCIDERISHYGDFDYNGRYADLL